MSKEEDIRVNYGLTVKLKSDIIDNIGLRYYISKRSTVEETFKIDMVDDKIFTYHFAYYVIKSIEFLIKGYPPPCELSGHLGDNFISTIQILNISRRYCFLLIIQLNRLIKLRANSTIDDIRDCVVYNRVISILEEKLGDSFLIKSKRYNSRSEVLRLFEKMRLSR